MPFGYIHFKVLTAGQVLFLHRGPGMGEVHLFIYRVILTNVKTASRTLTQIKANPSPSVLNNHFIHVSISILSVQLNASFWQIAKLQVKFLKMKYRCAKVFIYKMYRIIGSSSCCFKFHSFILYNSKDQF